MAIYELKGESLSIRVEGKGAELKSLTDNRTGEEYMWNADLEFWPRTSPVLFPFVGRLKGQQYTYREKTYTAPVHGFARDMEFELLEQTKDSMRFGIKDTEQTREVYPFFFSFEILYKLEGKELKVTFLVKNEGDDELFFSLGAHPGFVCPRSSLQGEEKRSDCYIRFAMVSSGNGGSAGEDAGVDKLISRGVDMDTGLVNEEYTEYALQDGALLIADDLFKQDALVLEKNQVNQVALLDSKKNPYVTLTMDAPVYGIWSSVKPGAPFICIEPWFGRCDALCFEGGLEEREYQNRLESGEIFETEYTVTIA